MKLMTAVMLSIAIPFTTGCTELETEQLKPTTEIIDRSAQKVSFSTSPLMLKDAVRLGVLSSSDVSEAELGIQQKDNEIVIAKASFYPEIYASVTPNADKGKLASADAGIRYNLFDFGQRAAELNGSVSAAKKSRYDLVVEIETAASETLQRYIAVSIEETKLSASTDYVKRVKDLESGVRARVDIGIASSVDVNEIETAKIKANTSVIEAKADRNNAREALSSVLGVSPRSVLSPSKIRKALIVNSKLKTEPKFAKYPKIIALQNQVEQAEFDKKAAEAGLLPRIGLKLGIGAGISSNGGISGTGVTAGPEISEVISLGGGRKERVENAAISVEVALRNRDEEIRLAMLELAQAKTSLAASSQRVAQRREILDLTLKTRDVMFIEYEVDTRSLRDLLDAEERIFQADIDLRESRRQNLNDLLRYILAMNLSSQYIYEQPE